MYVCTTLKTLTFIWRLNTEGMPNNVSIFDYPFGRTTRDLSTATDNTYKNKEIGHAEFKTVAASPESKTRQPAWHVRRSQFTKSSISNKPRLDGSKFQNEKRNVTSKPSKDYKRRIPNASNTTNHVQQEPSTSGASRVPPKGTNPLSLSDLSD